MNKRISIPVLFLAASVFLCRGADAAGISWKYDLPAAFEEAGKTGKPVMVDFFAVWCGWCKKMDADIYGDPAVRKLAEEFINVKIDGDKNENLTVKYRVTGYPTIMFFDSGGSIVANMPGYPRTVDNFVRTMNGVLSKAKKPAGGLTVTDELVKDKKIKTPSVGSDFVYNGYVEAAGEELIAQINYGGLTYFVRKGDIVKEYRVVSVDKGEVVMEGEGGRLVMEFKKPVSGEKGASLAKEKERAAKAGAAVAAPLPAGPDCIFSALGLHGALMVIFVVTYIYFALCLYFIAKKTQTRHAWLAWIPVADIFLMCSAGRIRFWWLLLLLVPPVNIFMVFFVWYKVIKARGKPWWLLILSVVPIVNYVAMGYLAFSE